MAVDEERWAAIPGDIEALRAKLTWRWLKSTRKLQETHYGLDYETLKGDKLADYLMTHYTALTCELVEFMDEVNWKPWMTDRRGEVSDRTAAVGELIDAAHFLANLACALGVTDAEWERLYQEKQERNRRRQESGSYSKTEYKCPNCHRELDRPGAITQIKTPAFKPFCCGACSTIIEITHWCSHCGLIEPKLQQVDGVDHCDNCGHAILV